MVVLEKKSGDMLQRTVVSNGTIICTHFCYDVEFLTNDLSAMYALFFNNNFNDAYSRNPDLNVAQALKEIGYGEIVLDESQFLPPDYIINTKS